MELENCTAEQFETFFDKIFEDKIAKNYIKDFLLNLNDINLPQNSFLGAIHSLKKRMTKISAPINALDVCGTGGDKLNTLNISTAVSFIVAGLGVCVAKHGNKAISSRSGSADIFQELDIKICDDKTEIEENLRNKNLCFLFAPLFHNSLKNVAEARKELGVATIFNFLGPLLNPANTRYQLIGTSNRSSMSKIASVISQEQKEQKHNSQVFIVHGFDGMDEITLTDNSYLIRCIDGKIADEEIINPQKLGFNKVKLSDIKGKDPKYNAKKLLELLNGKKSPYRDIAIINSAYALLAAKKVKNITEGLEAASRSIDNGQAFKVLESLKFSNSFNDL